jgi:hypothetical protein
VIKTINTFVTAPAMLAVLANLEKKNSRGFISMVCSLRQTEELL